MSRLINYPNNQPVRIYTDLCRLYEKGDRSFYDVLDSLVKVLNKDQLNQIEDILVNKYGELWLDSPNLNIKLNQINIIYSGLQQP